MCYIYTLENLKINIDRYKNKYKIDIKILC
jgi:hypothetical protein